MNRQLGAQPSWLWGRRASCLPLRLTRRDAGDDFMATTIATCRCSNPAIWSKKLRDQKIVFEEANHPRRSFTTCSAWSIGLSADGRGLVHDNESPTSATSIIRATAGLWVWLSY